MAEILVKVPITTNGTNPLIIGGMQQFKEVILSEGARKGLEKLNQKLPDHLKRYITDHVVKAEVEEVEEPAKPKKKNATA